jgi:hypothetical protein
MQEELKKNFDKLTIDEKRKFIITNILTDTYFNKIHNTIKDSYINYILEGDELIKYKLELNIKRNAKHISNALKEYEHAVDKCFVEYSRYKDLYYDVISCKESIENLCKSKYINGFNERYNPYYIFYDIIYCYSNTLCTIGKYGGETEGQSLLKAIKILLKNPYLCDGIKNDKSYKKYYDEYINKTKCSDDDNSAYSDDNSEYSAYSSYSDDEYDESENYNKDEKDVESVDDIELSDIENENSEEYN